MYDFNHNLKDIDFSEQDFEKARTLIYNKAGINLTTAKRDMVYCRLLNRVKTYKFQTFKEYLRLLDDPNHQEWQEFVNALTTNLTAFFREQYHFPILVDHVRKNCLKQRQITIWCAAASTGEEPYSIAMSLVEGLQGITHPPIFILATDIDTNVLKVAEAGVYSLDKTEKLSPEQVKRFFLRGTGNNDGFVKVRPEIRDLIRFRQVNLLEDSWNIRGPLDVIFCRNVMIYFDKKVQYAILKKLTPLLAPHGLLFAGHSESFHFAHDLLTLVGRTVYQLADPDKIASKPKFNYDSFFR